MEKGIRHLFTFRQPPEVVWDYLTKPDLLAQWLMPSNFQPILGHKFQFTARAKPRFGFDGHIYCEVLEIEPPKRLSYSWKGGTGGNVSLDSVVTWTLTPKENGTELLLEHKGFKGIKNYLPYLIMNKGWAKIGKRLSKSLSLVAPADAQAHSTQNP